ncbi:helix-turn-helix domain-containing protein [Bacillus sp. 7884-1]|uniref:helix-turn-helix domain-containing protein n=1 Tax=Bacillus sp. 7884-1 TaxID=2021693 RepID=UPI000BA5DEDC|nr:helix-turn-helix domain-containing protein [Bacillus sp. 7884-1]PAE35442.1 hypothetical protein CHI06_23635 [Bacillus sp. 7884-1]
MVSTNRFRLVVPVSDTDEALKHYYKSWRDLNQTAKSGFMRLDNAFKDKYLKELGDGALKLYLYFCFHAANETGDSWHSIPRIAEFFNGAQTRTIDNWIKTLVDKNLIYRASQGKKSYTTYLLPFSDTIVRHSASKKRASDNQESLDDLLMKIKELRAVYGEIVKVHHLFQWEKQKGKPVNRDRSQQYLLIITKRNNGVLIGHLYALRKSDHLCVSQLDIEEPAIFNSPFRFHDSNVVGLALPSFPAIGGKSKTAIKEILDLIRELAEIEPWKLEDRPKLIYGDKDEILPVQEEDPEIKEADEELDEEADEEPDEEA